MENKKRTIELKKVENLIVKDLNKEKTISSLYRHIFKSKGKKLRARLSLIASSIQNHKDRVKLASVIELLHTATLVHDDVVDNSETRRGAKSINSLWTNAHSVLIGDYIYSKAFIYTVEVGNLKIFSELANASNEISQGELMQLGEIGNIKISLNKLKQISYYKTGRLFEASAITGAILSSGSKTYIKNIGECAKNLGILFQVKDDLLDYSLQSSTGKPSLQDLAEGKITYPLYYAFKNASKSDRSFFIKCLGNKKALENKVLRKEVIQNISKLNGIKKTEDLAMLYHSKTLNCADKIKNKNIKEEMIELANMALNRNK